MHCDICQRSTRSLQQRNLCEELIRFDFVCIIDQPAQSLFSLWEVLLRAIGFFTDWEMNLLLWASTSAVLIPMCASPKRYWGQELTQFISNKAVADGAVSFYIDRHHVSARFISSGNPLTWPENLVPITLKNLSDEFRIEYMYLEKGVNKFGLLREGQISEEPTMFRLNTPYMYTLRGKGRTIISTT